MSHFYAFASGLFCFLPRFPVNLFPSLTDRCRQLIRKTTPVEKIDELPLPERMLSFIKYEAECRCTIDYTFPRCKTTRANRP
eukprot:m.17446 g.17446  ORF g.17446 m.17446 type:complete len:82 (+) comp8288_c0_seq1:91-336(+)